MEKTEKLFDAELVLDLINKVKGKSSLSALSPERPVPFNGSKEFIFTMDNEVDIVAENGKKTHGGVNLSPVIIRPIKFEYGARISDEFLYMSEEKQIDILKSFNDGFARKVARGLDFAAIHGINPRTGEASDVVGNNCFDKKVTQTVTYDAAKIDENIETAVEIIEGAEKEVNGMAMATQCRSALAKLKNENGTKVYPELAWGQAPSMLNGLNIDVNSTVNNKTVKDKAIIGDFVGSFKWGYSEEVPFEIIKYGDPDNSGQDLRGYNQVYLRAEIFLGWGILDESAFARIVEA